MLLVALLAVFLPLAFIEWKMLGQTGGVFMYPLDDTFIHMELARNLAFHQTWGINPGEFGSASSSLLYTVLLAGLFKIFSPHVLIPVLLNSIVAIFLIVVIHNWLRKRNLGPLACLTILLAVVFFTPLPMLIMSGMEHTLQCLFSFLFITRFSSWLAETRKGEISYRIPESLMIYSLLLPALRYEGLFLVGIAVLLLAYYRKWTSALLVGSAAALPLLAFGIYSVSQGSYALPNSVLVKAEGPSGGVAGFVHFFSTVLIDRLTTAKGGITALATQRLLIILPITYFVFRQPLRQQRIFLFMLIFLLTVTLIHLALASTGWFYRYEAYLMLTSIVFIGVLVIQWGKSVVRERMGKAWAVAAVAIFFLFFPMVLRTSAAFTKAAQAGINIHDQQYQMGRFLRENYNRDTVAANDIGAISFFTETRIVDLWGLGSIDVARSKKGRYFTPEFLDSFSRRQGARIAIVYDTWFPDSLLKRWQKAGTWQVQNNVILGDDEVHFYAIDPAAAPALRKNLEAYQSKLPQTVRVTYY